MELFFFFFFLKTRFLLRLGDDYCDMETHRGRKVKG